MYRHQNRWWKTFSQSEQAEDLHSGILLPWSSEHQFQRICIWEEVPHSFSITLPKPYLKLKRHDSGANCTLSLWRTAKHLTNNDWCVKYHCYQYLPDWAALVINMHRCLPMCYPCKAGKCMSIFYNSFHFFTSFRFSLFCLLLKNDFVLLLCACLSWNLK